MTSDENLDVIAAKVEPSRRKFILGLLAAGVTAPSVASFVMGKSKSGIGGSAQAIRPSSIVDASGNFSFSTMDPSGNLLPNYSANFMYELLSGNFLRDASGNFLTDASGNLLCGTSGNILLDGSGNALVNPSGNIPYLLDPSGNWGYGDPSANAPGLMYEWYSGNLVSWVELDASGNAFYDTIFSYDSNGVVDWYSSPPSPGLACVVSANHILPVQSPNTTVPATTTTTTPVPPVTVTGTIPTVK